MAKKHKTAQTPALDFRLLAFIRLLWAVSLVISCYLAWIALSGATAAGCGPDSGCDQVLQSRWSKWLRLPVSLFAVPIYGGMLVSSFLIGESHPPARRRAAWTFLFPAALIVLGSVAWFVGLQVFLLKHFCKFCMAVHTCGALGSLLLLMRAPLLPEPDKPGLKDKLVVIPPARAKLLAFAAFAGLAVLALGQVAYVPPAAAPKDVAGGALKTQARVFEIYNGLFKFQMEEVPLIGAPEAPKAMVSLFDYTCHHCREMHHHLEEVHRAFPTDLAIISLPMPLDSQCNHTVRRTPSAHVGACDYARLGLAVWRGNRMVHPAFEQFLFGPDKPPPLPQAREYAAQLLGGTNQLATFMEDPWVQQQLQQSVSVYATNMFRYKNGSMPQLIIGTNLVGSDSVGHSGDLFNIIARQLGLTTNSPSPQPAPIPR